MNSAEQLEQLMELQRGGQINTSDFLRMSKELGGAPLPACSHSPEPCACGGAACSSDAGGESSVPPSTPSSASKAAASSAASPASSTSKSQPQTPQKAAVLWDSGTIVFSTELKINVTFLRLGGSADFVNEGRARIQYERVKPGKVRAKETFTVWVKPETLEAIPIAGQVAESPSRKSPRVAEQTAAAAAPRAAELPELAPHERERKLPKKREAPVRGPNKMERTTKESQVPVEQRIHEFPGQSLCKDFLTGKVRCAACKKTLTNLKETIRVHCSGEAHGRELLIWSTSQSSDTGIKADLVDYFERHPDEAVGTKDQDALLYRYRVTESFVKTPPFAHVDRHQQLLQRAGHALPESSNLKRFIPRVEANELALLDSEIQGQYLGLGFDGTTRLGEAINTTARWISKDFYIKMRLIDFTTLKKHLNAIQLAAHEVEVTRQRGIGAARVVNLVRDSASVNGAACRRMLVTFTSAVGTLCGCHTLCIVGVHFDLPTLAEFKTPWLELAGGRNPHHGAKALWKAMVEVSVPGYSNVRWYAWAEITFVIAEAGMKMLGDFITACEEREYGAASTSKLRTIYNEKLDALRLELAAMIDMRILVKTTYDLEGDRLELLRFFELIESLRALGNSIRAGEDGVLPTVDAVLRRMMVLKKGVKIEKYYHGHGLCVAQLVKEEVMESTLYPGKQRKAWMVKYESDGLVEHFEEEELRSGKHGGTPNGEDGKPVLIVRDLPERRAICDALVPGFDYLEARITGTCDAQYSLVEMHELCKLVRAFDPNFALVHVDAAYIDQMVVITPLNALDMLDDMKQQLPAYLTAAATAPTFDKGSMADYSDAILGWWRANGSSFPGWAIAARVVFAISPNSASCERVFSLLANLFGESQMLSLSDLIQASLMLNYHGRTVG